MNIEQQIDYHIFELIQNIQHLKNTCNELKFLIPEANPKELETILQVSKDLQNRIFETLSNLNEKAIEFTKK